MKKELGRKLGWGYATKISGFPDDPIGAIETYLYLKQLDLTGYVVTISLGDKIITQKELDVLEKEIPVRGIGTGFVTELGGIAGEGTKAVIPTYLYLLKSGLTTPDTVIKINENKYPVGLFDESNMQLFTLGITSLSNIWTFNSYYYYEPIDKFESLRYEQAEYFLKKMEKKYKDGENFERVFKAFDELCKDQLSDSLRQRSTVTYTGMFSEYQWEKIRRIAADKKSKAKVLTR